MSKKYVAVIGGAIAGAEAAVQMAEKGFEVVVFDQMMLPYGKIEDGLPKWHHKLREKETSRIDAKIMHDNVRFIPGVRIGRDISFEDLQKEWGFSAVMFATGAWNDRPLGIDGIDAYINKGLVYQNKLLYWFNHKHESDYSGTVYNVPEGAAVIGGGLASLDVMKIMMMESVSNALEARGISESMFDFEKLGVSKILDKHSLTLEELGVKPATLFYRRKEEDMPLSPRPRTTPEEIANAQRIAMKIMTKYKDKYLFKLEELSVLKGFEVENDEISALIFDKVESIDGKLVSTGNDLKYNTKLLVSSIGSVPEFIPGIPTKGALFEIDDKTSSRVKGYSNVFAVGNAVTGRGNIVESLKHSKNVTLNLIDNELEGEESAFASNSNALNNVLRNVENKVDEQIDTIVAELEGCEELENAKLIPSKIKALQEKVGFDGNYEAWRDRFRKERMI